VRVQRILPLAAALSLLAAPAIRAADVTYTVQPLVK
jgi:hypothetical protein